MPRKISTLLNVASKELSEKGVFDGFVDIDSRLHIDPSLLKSSDIPEFGKAREQFDTYFKEVLQIVKLAKTGDRLWREAHKRLIFKEKGNTALGYSKNGTHGSAIGPKLAEKILFTTKQIVNAGIDDPIIFELVGVFEEGIGADRISDMTIDILYDCFLNFTQRVSSELGIRTDIEVFENNRYEVPKDSLTNEPILFIPKSLLNNLPIAYNWEDIDRVCKYNEALRWKINKIIGKSWKSAMYLPKYQLKDFLISNPEVFNDLIEQYRQKPKDHYDFTSDPLGELIWAELSDNAVNSYPLDLSKYRIITPINILKVVTQICNHFKSLIENNGWFEYLYDQIGKQKPERAPQLLFYGISEAYCIANNLDVNREINSGIGSLDFKISKGYKAKVNVELKYSSNPNLLKGYENQLPAYNRAEKTDMSIYLIIRTDSNTLKINRLLKYRELEIDKGNRVPDIIIIDGRKQVSASKRR